MQAVLGTTGKLGYEYQTYYTGWPIKSSQKFPHSKVSCFVMSVEMKDNNATVLYSKFVFPLDTYVVSQAYALLKARITTLDIYGAQMFCIWSKLTTGLYFLIFQF